MKPLDILDALGSVDEALLLHSEQPLALRRGRVGNGVKIAIAAALLLAVGLGGFWLLRSGAHVASQPPEYTLPTLEPQKPTDPPLLPVTPIAYSTNWEGLQSCWLSEWGAIQAQRQPGEKFAPLPNYGEIPQSAQRIVDGNLFYGAEAFGDRLLVTAQEESSLSVIHYNKRGVFLGQWTDDRGEGWSVVGKTVTEDGGFLLALAFFAENGYSVKRCAVVKCDATGAVQWEMEPAEAGDAYLYFCFERNDAYYLFGKQGLDVCMLRLDTDGSVRDRLLLSDLEVPDGAVSATPYGLSFPSNDYHYLQYAEPTEEGFALYIRTQNNYSFHGWGILEVDAALNALSWQQLHVNEDVSARLLGVVDDEPLLNTDERLVDFPYGRLTAVLDYGDHILTVSELQTEGFDELVGSGRQVRHQTVYASFDKRGTLLWHAAADDGHTAIPVKQTNAQLSLTPDLGSLLPGSVSESAEDRISDTAQECMQQYSRFLTKNRTDLEWVAAEMLRLRRLSLGPDAPAHDLIAPSSSADAPDPAEYNPTPYFDDYYGLTFISSAVQAAADDSLQLMLRKLAESGGFDRIDAAPFPFSESKIDSCGFHSYHTLLSGGQRYQITIDLYYCDEPRTEQLPGSGNNQAVEWLDDRWCWVFRWEPSEN